MGRFAGNSYNLGWGWSEGWVGYNELTVLMLTDNSTYVARDTVKQYCY